MTGGDGFPETEIKTVRSSNHPAQVEIPPLAGGPGSWVGQEMIDAPGVLQCAPSRAGPQCFAQVADPIREGLPHGERLVTVRQVEAEERCLERARVCQDPLEQRQKKDQILFPLKPVGVSLVHTFPAGGVSLKDGLGHGTG